MPKDIIPKQMVITVMPKDKALSQDKMRICSTPKVITLLRLIITGMQKDIILGHMVMAVTRKAILQAMAVFLR